MFIEEIRNRWTHVTAHSRKELYMFRGAIDPLETFVKHIVMPKL